jgi:hypothetical protein
LNEEPRTMSERVLRETMSYWEKKESSPLGNVYFSSGAEDYRPYEAAPGVVRDDGGDKSRLPTSKLFHTGTRDRTPDEKSSKIFNEKNLIFLLEEEDPKGRIFKGRIVKHPEQRKRALKYVNELRQLGREAGEELRLELEKQK